MLFILFCLAALSCQALLPPTPTLLPTPTLPPPTSTATAVLPTRALPTPTARATSTFSPPLMPEPSDTAHGFSIRYHPDGGLYAGDLISIEVLAPADQDTNKSSLKVELENPGSREVARGNFSPFGIGQRHQATLIWAWDTRDLTPGDYTLRFTVLPQNISWQETVSLQHPEDRPLAEQQAAWATVRNECCTIHYITGSAAERDLPQLLLEIDAEAQSAVASLGIAFSEPITITLLPRLLGHGGFASSEIHVSYLDRNYAAGNVGIVVHHEMLHILDARLGGELRPSLLVEGLAVYLSGGHFKPEPLLPRAAALLEAQGSTASGSQAGLGRYLPLTPLADDFYHAQHEIGYLQGGALIEYMVQTWGWQAFSDFYRDIHPHPSGSQAQAIDAALQQHFDLTLKELEQDFIAALRRQPTSPEFGQDVLLTVTFFDAVRRYQQRLDPSAYFLTAWLLDTPTMRQRGIVADYVRHPRQAENLALETLLVSAAEKMAQGDYGAAENRLQAVNHTLEAYDHQSSNPFSGNRLAEAYLGAVQVILANPELTPDYEIQRMEIDNETARVWVSSPTTELFELFLSQTEAGWLIESAPITSGD